MRLELNYPFSSEVSYANYSNIHPFTIPYEDIARPAEWYSIAGQLSPVQPFAHFNLHLEHNIVNIIKNELHIDNPGEYYKFGISSILHSSLHNELEEFIQSLSIKNYDIASPLATLIVSIAKDILTPVDQGNDIWIILRGSQSDYENIKSFQWHKDDCFSDGCLANEIVFAFTLKGPSTLFYKLPTEFHKNFSDVYGVWEISHKFIDTTKIESAQFGEGTVFMRGKQDGAVHAVPEIKEERLFVALALGNKQKIAEFGKKFEAEFDYNDEHISEHNLMAGEIHEWELI